jgi:pyruvate dehydrogenase (quinone)/pyruvate oxidase
MKRTASDVLVDTLRAWGVEVVFGLPGDGINGIVEAMRKQRQAVRFIQVRHEEAAASMACAYAKHAGRLGCCLATSGPGGMHLLNGLYDAKLDGQQAAHFIESLAKGAPDRRKILDRARLSLARCSAQPVWIVES